MNPGRTLDRPPSPGAGWGSGPESADATSGERRGVSQITVDAGAGFEGASLLVTGPSHTCESTARVTSEATGTSDYLA